MKEAPGMNRSRNDTSRKKRNAWLLRAGLGSAPLFAGQVPAPDSGGIVAEYSRKAEEWDRMERRLIRRAHRLRTVVARRVSTVKLAELDRLRRKLTADPA
jgi:hypothetical protein